MAPSWAGARSRSMRPSRERIAMAVAPATAAARVTKRQFAIQLRMSKPAMEYFIAGFAFVDAQDRLELCFMRGPVPPAVAGGISRQISPISISFNAHPHPPATEGGSTLLISISRDFALDRMESTLQGERPLPWPVCKVGMRR